MTDDNLNPLIEEHPGDTAYLCRCAVSALARMQTDVADFERITGCSSDKWTDDQERGLALLTQCIEMALGHLEQQLVPATFPKPKAEIVRTGPAPA